MGDQMHSTRRSFLKHSSAVAAGTGLAGGLASRAYAAEGSELKIALIGAGGRGTQACVQALSTSGPIKLVAIADAFSDQIQPSLQSISKAVPNRVDVPAERQFAGFDSYKQAIDSGVDGVILTTPPGFRPMHFEYAVQQGKHVFMEKPVATDAPGVRKVLESNKIAKEKNLKVTVGLQRHYSYEYQEVIKRVHNGEIGDIIYLRCYWDTGPVWVKGRQAMQERKILWLLREQFPGETAEADAARRNYLQQHQTELFDKHRLTEMEYQMYNWYYFTWIGGDHIVEQHIHNLDVCNWVMKGHPTAAISHAGRQVRTGKEHGEIYDHHAVEFVYGEKWDLGTHMFSYCRQIEGCYSFPVSEHVYGTKGYATLSGATIYDLKGERVWRYDNRKDPSLPKASDPYQVEHDVLWDAVHNNKPQNDADNGAYSTLTAILGRQAGYTGKLLKFDQVLNSQVSLMPKEFDWKATPPVVPDANGFYPIPMPGQYDKV